MQAYVHILMEMEGMRRGISDSVSTRRSYHELSHKDKIQELVNTVEEVMTAKYLVIIFHFNYKFK